MRIFIWDVDVLDPLGFMGATWKEYTNRIFVPIIYWLLIYYRFFYWLHLIEWCIFHKGKFSVLSYMVMIQDNAMVLIIILVHIIHYVAIN